MAMTFNQAVSAIDAAWNNASGAGRSIQFQEAGRVLAESGLSQDRWPQILAATSIRNIYHIDVMEAATAILNAGTGDGGGTTTDIITVYKTFNQSEDVVKDVTRKVTAGMWTGNTGSLTTFFTSSIQSGSSGDWYYDVYNADPASDSSAQVQFAVTYGHRLGSGSIQLATDANSKLPTKANYSQYRNILLEPDDVAFTFAPGKSKDEIWKAVFLFFILDSEVM